MGNHDQGPLMFRSRRGEVTVQLTLDETELLRNLISEYEQLLSAEADPNDLVTRRLFPDASLDDDAVNLKFQELTRESLEEHKRETIKIANSSLGSHGEWEGWVSEDETDAWLVLLADLRLAIGVRIAVTEEMMDREADPRDPKQWSLAVLQYLGALQDSLLTAVTRSA
jgi:hypothetical protein